MAEITLKVANTSNVKEMKNGRPMNVKLVDADLENCVIVTLAEQPVDQKENDHVFVGTVLAAAEVADAVAAGTAYLVVAPEIMVEEARKMDGHIGKFRFVKDGVYTAYQLQPHDRIEVNQNHRYASGAGKVISTRVMAESMFLIAQTEEEKQAQVKANTLVKIEF
jgi:hypothetical protein